MPPRNYLTVFSWNFGCAAPNKFYKSLMRDKNKVSVPLSGEEIKKQIKMVVDLSLPVKLVADLHGINDITPLDHIKVLIGAQWKRRIRHVFGN